MTRRVLISAASIAAMAAVLSGCSAASEPVETSDARAAQAEHVHAIVPRGDGMYLLGTHAGLYSVDIRSSSITGPIGESRFDAMGLTAVGDFLIASGHPGVGTPAELGAPNLGIIRSADGGETWEPVAFSGSEDFHVLTADFDGQLYGVGSTAPDIRASEDGGVTWRNAASLAAADLAAAEGRLYAATPDGLMVSDDDAATFAPSTDAPTLYSVDAAGPVLAGVDVDGRLWRRDGDADWSPVGEAQGTVGALAATTTGIAFVDRRGLVTIDATGTTVIPLDG